MTFFKKCVKALVGAFKNKKVLVEASPDTVKLRKGSLTALVTIYPEQAAAGLAAGLGGGAPGVRAGGAAANGAAARGGNTEL